VKTKVFLVLYVLTFLPNLGFSQIEFKYGPEIGISLSDLRKYGSNSITYDSVTNSFINKRKSIIGPLIGLNSQLIFFGHLQLSIGMQYQLTGTQYYISQIRYKTAIEYEHETWDQYKYHKLCIPISVGYTFKIKKIQPSLNIGLRPNFILSGKYRTKSKSVSYLSSYPAPVESWFASKYDILEYMKSFHERSLCQFLMVFSANLGQHIKLTLSATRSKEITYKVISSTHSGSYQYQISIPNNDFGISLTYLFKKSQKSDSQFLTYHRESTPLF